MNYQEEYLKLRSSIGVIISSIELWVSQDSIPKGILLEKLKELLE
tara:strand:- start:17 stop:151 length:135 start_codon:yes stop_codon:yes gene_type:complete